MSNKKIFECEKCGKRELNRFYENAEKKCGYCRSPMKVIAGEIQETLR